MQNWLFFFFNSNNTDDSYRQSWRLHISLYYKLAEYTINMFYTLSVSTDSISLL